ncbi:19520_t:CDS:2, partial [Gigaspora rosea]
SDVSQIYVDLKDGHTAFTPSCYSAFFFFQEIWLYSTVDCKGKQVIKILQDDVDPSNNQCEVITIDGTPALKEITNFAKNKVKNSRDLGVRFNMALSSLAFSGGTFTINPSFVSSSLFSRRITLPESDSITYELKCNNSQTKTVVRPWIIINNSFNTLNFTDSKSYFESICLVQNTQNTQQPNVPQSQNSEVPVTLSTKTINVEFPNVEQVGNLDNFTIFYKFNNTGVNTGVVMIPTFLPSTYALDQNKFHTDLVAAFNNFSASGVKKVVLDFTNNGGGFIPLSQFFNEIFLRQKNFTFPRDIKINDVMSFLIKEADKEGQGSNTISFSPNQEQSIVTGQPFQNADEFIGNNEFKRGGANVKFTNLFVDILDDSPINGWKSPWTNKDIIILTNGACVSSCAQTVQYLSEQAKIATVSVGGFYKKKLSYSSFPGGNVVTINPFYSQINNITSNTTDSPPQIPKNFANDISMFSFTATYSETYSLKFPDMINEFMFRPADHRLFYDDESIINP